MAVTRYTAPVLRRLVRAVEDDGYPVVAVRQSFVRSRAVSFLDTPMIMLGTGGPAALRIVTLAHEYGHIISRVRGQAPPLSWMLGDIARTPLRRQQRVAIFDEEKRAWRHGFRFLRRQGVAIIEFARRVKAITLRHRRKELEL